MKLFFEITEGKKSHFITLFTRKQLSSNDTMGVTADVVEMAGKWSIANFNMIVPSRENSMIIRGLDALKAKAFESPVSMINALEEEGGRQIVYDKRQKKYRNVSTMKDDADRYEAVGTGISIAAPDEDLAERKLTSQIMKAMTKNPEDAAELAEWFTKGRKIKLLESGEVPGYSDRSVFANKGEDTKKKLAIKKVVKKNKKK